MTATQHLPGHATGLRYDVTVQWAGNGGAGTTDYASYSRDHRITAAGKPALAGSADPAFRGSAERYNPEELLVAALSACHMLAYLALCAGGGVRVTDYEDNATGMLTLATEGGRFERVELRPVVTVADAATQERARALHDVAHRCCFIAASCRMPVHIEALVRVEES